MPQCPKWSLFIRFYSQSFVHILFLSIYASVSYLDLINVTTAGEINYEASHNVTFSIPLFLLLFLGPDILSTLLQTLSTSN